MAIDINAKTTGVGGLETSADNSGNINIQSGGTTVMAVTSSGVDVTGDLSIGGSSLAASPSFRNLIINGDMRVAQKATTKTGTTTGNGYSTVDRWNCVISSAGTWTISQDTDVPSGQGFANSMKWDCTVADGSLSAGDYILFTQRIEGQNLQHLKKGTSNAEKLTASFWVKSNKTGTYVVEFRDQDNTRTNCQSYTIDAADTWEKKTITIDGDTTGTLDNDNARSFEFFFWLAAGSTFTSGTLQTSWAASNNANRAVGQVNLADSTSNYINITGVQLEVGSTATEFEHLPYDVELAMCQRYFQVFKRSSGSGIVPFATGFTSTNQFYGQGKLHKTMRAAPTFSINGTVSHVNYTHAAVSANLNATPTIVGNTDSFYINASSSTGTTNNAGAYIRIVNTATQIEWSAEL